jgi:hypothetical protein
MSSAIDRQTLRSLTMPDPRFARLTTDPRFRRPRRQRSKIVVDDRFKGVFDQGKKNRGASKKSSVFAKFTSHH